VNKKSLLILIGILILSSFLFLSLSHPAQASILDDIVNSVKNFFSPAAAQQLSITSKIELAPNGDINKNGTVDAGDTIRFVYVITNTTSNTYSFATLKTKINTNSLNSISSMQGAVSINDANHTLTIPNLHIHSNQQLTISFDAHANFNKDSNQTVSTEPELVDQNNTVLVKGQKQEVTVNKMSINDFNTFVHITK